MLILLLSLFFTCLMYNMSERSVLDNEKILVLVIIIIFIVIAGIVNLILHNNIMEYFKFKSGNRDYSEGDLVEDVFSEPFMIFLNVIYFVLMAIWAYILYCNITHLRENWTKVLIPITFYVIFDIVFVYYCYNSLVNRNIQMAIKLFIYQESRLLIKALIFIGAVLLCIMYISVVIIIGSALLVYFFKDD